MVYSGDILHLISKIHQVKGKVVVHPGYTKTYPRVLEYFIVRVKVRVRVRL